jgi:hypothetical protein
MFHKIAVFLGEYFLDFEFWLTQILQNCSFFICSFLFKLLNLIGQGNYVVIIIFFQIRTGLVRIFFYISGIFSKLIFNLMAYNYKANGN